MATEIDTAKLSLQEQSLKEEDEREAGLKKRTNRNTYKAARRELQNQKDKIIESETKKIVTAELRRQVRNEIRHENAQLRAEESGIKVDEDGVQEEKVTVTGKAEIETELEPRYHVIPSALHCRSYAAGFRRKYDDQFFESRKKTRYDQDKVSGYIEKMYDFFDVEPYYEIQKEYVSNKVKMTKIEIKSNDLPLFSNFGFESGLTNDDIKTLCATYERFLHAYKLCKQKQEYILITNMLHGFYSSNAATFAAKNLLGWRSESSVHVDGELDVTNLINSVIDDNKEDDFIDGP